MVPASVNLLRAALCLLSDGAVLARIACMSDVIQVMAHHCDMTRGAYTGVHDLIGPKAN
jgi:hypothetical protein